MADQSQLDLELQINKAIQARQALLNTQKSMLVDQIAFAQELCRAMECKELDGYNERLQETRENLLKASTAADDTTKSTQNMTKQMKRSGKGMKAFKAVALGAAVAIKNAFGMAFKVIKGIGSFVKNALVGAFKIVKFAMSGWSKMLGNIAAKGMEAANAGIGLKNAYEDVREAFGGLQTTEGRAVIGMFDEMRANSNNLAGSGLSLSRVFGRGPDGLAAALGYVNETIQNLGPSLDRFGTAIAGAGDQVILLGRSLGFGGEDFANMATIAGYAGESVEETMDRMGREILTVSRNLGVNRQVLADNMKTLMKMPEVYGSNTKEMMKTSVAAQKLGVSIEQLHGPMKIFDDFESAATNAADLAAEFGIMVDATDMMTAEPAEQMLMLKDAAAAAGKDFESMSRQERRRLAELTGMDADALFKSMDPSNAFDMDSLDAAGNQVDAATAATMAQRDATNELASAMRRLHESMEPMNTQGGFFGAFTHGMMQGMMRSEEGRAIIQSVTEAFRIVYQAGKEVGVVLMRLFNPGGPLYFLYEYFTTLPERMEQLMPKVIDAFNVFVNDLMIGGDTAAGALRKLVSTLAYEIFGSSGGVLDSLVAGFHHLGDMIIANMIGLVPYILEGFITAFQFAIDMMLGNGPDFGAQLADTTIMPMTRKAFNELLSSGVVGEFGSKFMEMLQVFWDQYGEQITDFLSKALSAIFIAALAQSLIPILASGAILSLVKGVFGAMGGALGGLGGAGGAPSPDIPGAEGGKLQRTAKDIIDAVDELNQTSPGEVVKAGLVLLAIAGTFMLAIIGIGATTLVLEQMGVSDITFLIAAAAMYGMAKMTEAMIPVLTAIKTMNVSLSDMAKAAAAIFAVGIVFGAVMFFVSDAIRRVASIGAVDPGLMGLVEAAGDLALTGLIVTGAIVAMGTMLAAIVLLSSNPITGTILAAGIAAAGLIFAAAMGLVVGTITYLATFTPDEATAAKHGAEAAGIVVETTLKVIQAIWDIMKGLVWDQDAFYAILTDMENVVRSITFTMLPMVQRAAAMITEDPQVIKDKMEIITSLLDSFSPIMDIMTAAMSIEDMDPNGISVLVETIGQSISGIISSIEHMVRGIVDSMTGLSEAEIASAAAAAPLLQATAGLIGAIMPASSLFEDQMKQGLEHYIDYEGLNSNEVAQKEVLQKTSAEKQREFITFFVDMLHQIGDPIQSLVEQLSTITIPGDPEVISAKMQAVGAIMGAVASAGDAITAMKEAGGGSDRQGNQVITTTTARELIVSMQTISNLFTGAGMPGGQGLLDVLRPAIQAMVDFSGLFPSDAGDKMDASVTLMTTLNRLMATAMSISEEDVTNFAPRMRGVATAITGIDGLFTAESMKPLTDMMDAFAGLDGYFSTGQNMDTVATNMQSFATRMSTAMTSVQTMAGSFRDTAVQPLLDMITAYEELNEATSERLGTIDINEMLQAFGEALAIHDQTITVEKEQLQVNIHLNVVMRTRDVAEQLLEGDYVTGTERGLRLLDD